MKCSSATGAGSAHGRDLWPLLAAPLRHKSHPSFTLGAAERQWGTPSPSTAHPQCPGQQLRDGATSSISQWFHSWAGWEGNLCIPKSRQVFPGPAQPAVLLLGAGAAVRFGWNLRCAAMLINQDFSSARFIAAGLRSAGCSSASLLLQCQGQQW